MVTLLKNEVSANTISRAIIENVNGEINTNGLDIITDYNKLYALSKSNITSVKLGSIASVDSSGVVVGASFKSGIDSMTGLILNNSGDTTITTAKDNGSEGILAKGEIHNVSVSLIGFYAGTSAKSENTSNSTTVLKANSHNAKNLYVNSYLNSKALTDSGATKVDLFVGVNSSSAESKNTSTLNVDVGGGNTIVQNAKISAVHNAAVNSDLSAFGFSLVGGGTRLRLTSDLVGNTNGTIGGYFNAGSTSIDFKTTRDSFLSKSSGSGAAIVAVNDSKATNHITGTSSLTVSNMNSDSSNAINNLLFSIFK